MSVRCRRGPRPSTFAAAAWGYWTRAFPCARRQLRRWRRRAGEIGDPRLAALALATLREEHGNLEGAAAYALLAPREHRGGVVRATVAFQALYDFLDTVAELPAADPAGAARMLHEALPAALDPEAERRDWFERSAFPEGDGGYVDELIAACRAELQGLPGVRHVRRPAVEAARRMVVYQACNHDGDPACRALRKWAETGDAVAEGLTWWEGAAAAASSLGVFALIALAARPGAAAAEARRTAAAYFPWSGALHVLLDSLVDVERDLETGETSLVGNYSSQREAAMRLGTIAARAERALAPLAQGEIHRLILSAMASFYLTREEARTPRASAARSAVLGSLGAATAAPRAILRVRERTLAATRNSSSRLSTCPFRPSRE